MGMAVAKVLDVPELDIADVTRIARKAALEQSLPLEVLGAHRAGEDGDYVEIVVKLDDCLIEPCQFAIGAFRGASETHLLHDIAEQLRRHVDLHRSTRSRS